MKKPKIPTVNDIMKYEIASELGLLDKIADGGWKSLTAKESGRIGGILAKRKRDKITAKCGDTDAIRSENA